jgi:PAS domain S-box-containing protein
MKTKKLGIVTKFNLLTISIIVTTSVGIAWYLAYNAINERYKVLLYHGKSFTQLVAKNSEHAVYSENITALEKIVSSIDTDDNVGYLIILDKKKQVLAYKTKDPSIQSLPMKLDSELSKKTIYGKFINKLGVEKYLVLEEPVIGFIKDDIGGMFLQPLGKKNPVTIGYVQLGYSLMGLRNYATQLILITILFMSILVIVGIILTVLMAKRITKPIKKIIEISSKIARGDFNSELEVSSNDEIAELAIATNEMSRKLRESIENLERSEKKYRLLFESINDVVCLLNSDSVVLSISPSVEKLLGYKPEDIVGKPLQNLSILVPKSFEMAIIDIKRMIAGESIESSEYEFITKDGNRKICEISGSPLFYDEQVAGVIYVVRDITEREKMKQQLIQSDKLKSLGELSGGVAHDFNNVLAAILGRVQLLEMQCRHLFKKQENRKSILALKAGLEVIERATTDGAETVRRIQEFSRRRSDDKEYLPVDTNELIDNALEFTRMRWKDKAESKGIKYHIEKEFSSLPPVTGRSSELREVFTNLINNALDVMPEGGRIKIKTFTDNNLCIIKIEDTGIGIPKDKANRIFDPFFTTKGPQSTGLGLSVSYGIINRHRGTIKVDSIEGQGTIFTIQLPFANKICKQPISKEKCTPKPQKQRKARILIIDDEADVCELLRDILTDGGHEVETASDGSTGIKLFKEKEFDLVFTDLGMPGISGWQVAEKIKSINKSVPVTLITGWNVDLKQSEIKENGVDLIAYKPFEVKQVFKLVQEGMILKDRFKAA